MARGMDKTAKRVTRRRSSAYLRWVLSLSAGLCLSGAAEVGGVRPKAGEGAVQDGFTTLIMLADFEDARVPAALTFNNAAGRVIEYDGRKVLHLKLNTRANAYSGVQIKPAEPLDLSGAGSVSIAFDAVSLGAHTAQLMLAPSDKNGGSHVRSGIIHAGGMQTYYSLLTMNEVLQGASANWNEFNLASGMRSDPPMFPVEAHQFAWMWGTRNLDLRGITAIAINSMTSPHNKEVLIDNIRIVENPSAKRDGLAGLVDTFGQAAKRNYPGKVHSLAELLAMRDAEIKSLKEPLLKGRSKYGGWAEGPRLAATGYFRTRKVGDQWSLVDPEGYLYLSLGINVIRRGDTATITGLDTTEAYQYGDKFEDYEFETVSETRRNMFEWLPPADHALARHYGYVFNVHSGLLQRGVTYDFYAANLQRKYGAGRYLERWRQVTVDRMVSWGFTSLGNWTEPALYDNGKIPYVANRWIQGRFKRVSSGHDLWEAPPDVFDPVFAQAVVKTVREVAAEVNGSPWCMGVFLDNEISFGRPDSNESRYGIVLDTLARDAAEVPAKAAFSRILKNKYSSIEALGEAWETDLKSWEAFDKGAAFAIHNDRQLKDCSMLLEAYAEKYFALVGGAMDTYMPNHLYLGARFADWGMPIEAVRAAARHADVLSFNLYKEGLMPYSWAFLHEIDKPCIIGEFGNGASSDGHYHFGVVAAANQEDRAAKMTDYLDTVLANPFFIGVHWFQYLDSPLTGRVFDGENYNNGFVSVCDIPYQPMVDAAKAFTATMYERKFGDMAKKLPD